jgi:hypothetical protein
MSGDLEIAFDATFSRIKSKLETCQFRVLLGFDRICGKPQVAINTRVQHIDVPSGPQKNTDLQIHILTQ